MTIKEQIQHKLIELGSNTILIHSDLMCGFNIPFSRNKSFLISHIAELMSLKKEASIWMPAFNYDFLKGAVFNIEKTPSKVGVLTEHFRKTEAEWRTPIPVFSFAGIGEQPILDISETIDPFGLKSAFHHLYINDSILMHYGSTLNSSTILHYVERISNRLSYRYDKLFHGKISISNDKEIDVKFNYHVRPLGEHLEYDINKIEKDLLENGVLSLFKEGQTRILIAKVTDLTNFWKSKMEQDSLYFLDNQSKIWIEPFLDKVGRPFILTDFEKQKEL
ncbi:MAG: AAC(3) family N-acetyltransferase [Bacteroidetes bacterium]|nr:AAC(3) family N-acetyltransferase [Bacteroidota bacterium]